MEGSLFGNMTSGVAAIASLLSSPSSKPGGGGGTTTSFRVTWKELAYLVLAIFVLASLSICMASPQG